MDLQKPRAEALAVADGKFVAVGTNREVLSFAGPATRKIDAAGKLVIPGFNDSHVHFAAIGNKFSTIDLRKAKDPDEIVELIAEYARFLPEGRWILGGGWNEKTLPSKASIDAATPNNPVFVYSNDAKSAFANAVALERSGSGNSATGIVTGAALARIAAAVPKDHTRNWPEIIETATNYAASLGVTSVQDMHSDELGDVYRQLHRAGKLKTRVYDCSPISAVPQLVAKGVKAATGDAMVRTGCVKYFSDGDDAESADLKRDIAAADKAGLQVMIHAIGAKANSIVLDAFENAIKLNGRRDRRFRIEHAQNASAADLPRFARASVIASMQPWLFKSTNPSIYKTHLQLGTKLAFGSDASITDFDPLLGVQAATTGPNAMSIDEAIYTYTVGSAYAEFQEKVKGAITVGKLADLIIFSDKIKLEASSENDRGGHAVHLTIVGGKVVFQDRDSE